MIYRRNFETSLLDKDYEVYPGVIIIKNMGSEFFEIIKESNLIFPVYIISDEIIIIENSINKLANKIANYILSSIKNEKITKNWFTLFLPIIDNINIDKNEKTINSRLTKIKKIIFDILKRKVSRVAKLASDNLSFVIKNWVVDKKDEQVPVKLEINGKILFISGLAVLLYDFDKAFVSRKIYWNGQSRMKFDKNAPSRSYLKIEEAFFILKHFYNIEKPGSKDIVVDIGAAPGGWSYSCAKNNAIVFAIDNGPLKKGALNNKNIIHLRKDGFKITPEIVFEYLIKNQSKFKKIDNFRKIKIITKNNNHYNRRVSFLLCDMIEKPDKILTLLERWIKNKWCEIFIVNLKFGYSDPLKLIDKVNSNSLLKKYCAFYFVKHLNHDRDEMTLIGKVL